MTERILPPPSPLPAVSPKHFCTFLLRPHGVAVTVMVTFTGASVDSCAGSKPGMVDGVSPPERTDKNKERGALGVSQIVLKGQERPSIMHETQGCSPYT